MPSQSKNFEELLKEAVCYYRRLFGCEPTAGGVAPGRVNLIGDHVDYNQGFVLPMALPLVTVVVGGPNCTDICCIRTTSDCVGENTEARFSVPSPTEGSRPNKGVEGGQNKMPPWGNYVMGVVNSFPGTVKGFSAVIVSSVPVGAGLSSSAAIEVAVYSFLESFTGQVTENLTDKALACQKAEHEYAGMPCGIMDQYISVYAKANEVCLLDCRDLKHSGVPWKDREAVVLVTNSHVRHNLSESEYPERRAACQEASNLLGIGSLRDATLGQLEDAKDKLGMSDVVFMRARHAVTEIRRTYEAAKALRIGDYSTFGLLMCQSHNSLRDDYEVSCPELDRLVDVAVNCPGVFGSRMTGAGFGGCTVTLLKKDAVRDTIQKIREAYKGEVTFYIVAPADGARSFSLPLKS